MPVGEPSPGWVAGARGGLQAARVWRSRREESSGDNTDGGGRTSGGRARSFTLPESLSMLASWGNREDGRTKASGQARRVPSSDGTDRRLERWQQLTRR